MISQADKGLTRELKTALLSRGAALIGFADLRELPEDARDGFPYGVVIGMAWEKDVLHSIADGPTHAYHQNYDDLNERLDNLSLYAEKWLVEKGFRALAKTRQVVGAYDGVRLTTKLPHKTVATRAGVGWIGKCALLVTPEFGSALRISSTLADAPLETGTPVNESHCGECAVCREICPAKAVSGNKWSAGLPREEFWNAQACRETALARSREKLGEDVTLCGLCILRCPWTQKYLKG